MKSKLISGAFTLAEMLAVVAIIVIVLAILLPMFGRSREVARRAICLSQARQMVVAAYAYTTENGNSYPIAYDFIERGDETHARAWDLTTITRIDGTMRIVPGILWSGQGTPEIQQCPSYRGEANWYADPYTGYNYNTSYIGHGQFEAIVEPAKKFHIKRPAATAIFGDGQYIAGANKFMRAPWPNPGDEFFNGRWAGTQGFRHLTQTNVAYCDGHAESRRERFISNQDGAANVAVNTGFLSSDNRAYGGE